MTLIMYEFIATSLHKISVTSVSPANGKYSKIDDS